MPNLWAWTWESGTSSFGVTGTLAAAAGAPWWPGQPDNGGLNFPNTELCVETGFYTGAAQVGRWTDLPCKVSQLGALTTRRFVCELDK